MKYRPGYKKSRKITLSIAADDYDFITSELDRAGISLSDFASGAVVQVFRKALDEFMEKVAHEESARAAAGQHPGASATGADVHPSSSPEISDTEA